MFTRRLGVLTALVQGLGLLQGSRISVRLFGDHYSTKVSRSFVSKEVSRETVVQRERELSPEGLPLPARRALF